jgi:glucose/mannose transport system permease protein
MSGYVMAMFLAGIRGVPEELREAARVDGCTEVGVYYRIVLPQLKPIILSAVIVLGHISLKIFDLVFAMAGPDNAQTIVPGILVYTEGFRANNFAVASSVAVIMLFFVALVIIPYLWSQLRESRS